MDETTLQPDLFDRARKRAFRDRAANICAASAAGGAPADFLNIYMAEEILERLDLVTRTFEHALIIGSAGKIIRQELEKRGIKSSYADAGYENARALDGVQCDEDRLPFAKHSFDLVISVGIFDTVNDLPGSLSLLRRILKPDGLLLGAFVGAGSLSTLKESMMAADGDHIRPHIHPQIDVRSTGDLLSRAGFALPVADGAGLRVRYGSIFSLVKDLRASAYSNILANGSAALNREQLAHAAAHFASKADHDGRVSETFELVYLSGWAPDASQPQPARRGSGKASLADTLARFKPQK